MNINEIRDYSQSLNSAECKTIVEVISLTLGRYGDGLLKLNWAIKIKQSHVKIDIGSYINIQTHPAAFSYLENHVETKVAEGGLQCVDLNHPATGGIVLKLHLHDGTMQQCQFEAPPLG
jgi:hypothetical protein